MNRDICENCGGRIATIWKCDICDRKLCCEGCANSRVWYAFMKEHDRDMHHSVELVDV